MIMLHTAVNETSLMCGNDSLKLKLLIQGLVDIRDGWMDQHLLRELQQISNATEANHIISMAKKLLLSSFSTHLGKRTAEFLSDILIQFLQNVTKLEQNTLQWQVIKMRKRIHCVVIGGGTLEETHISEAIWIERAFLNQQMPKLLEGVKTIIVLSLDLEGIHTKQKNIKLVWFNDGHSSNVHNDQEVAVIRGFFQKLKTEYGINCILSCHKLSDIVSGFCIEFNINAVQMVTKEDIQFICDELGIHPVTHLKTIHNNQIGHASHISEVTVANRTFLRIIPHTKPSYHLVIRAPTEEYVKVYSNTIKRGVDLLYCWLETDNLSIIQGAGYSERYLFQILDKLATDSMAGGSESSYYLSKAFSILSSVALAIPQQLTRNKTRLFGNQKEDWFNVSQQTELVVEPTIIKYYLWVNVVDILIRVLRIEEIICLLYTSPSPRDA
eukprot:TRINITY_DN4299_c0_g1_i1.p1 TRINITY_DN4299_c0_g1~~TRINITY_DN4299_c0_g1_i1.p1  ORF type:complete len:440 (+),score=71.45 TRINITY_DN4299_c0_g1_i1:226-1545(+)